MLAFLPIGRWTILSAIALFVALTYARWKKYPTAPGPMIARFTNMWQAYQMNKGDFHKLNIELHRKHGKIVRLGPKYYSIDDADAAKIIYGHGTQYTKAEWYEAWQTPRELLDINLFAQQDIKQHAAARRQFASLYSMSAVVEYEAHVDKCIDTFCQVFEEFADKGKTLDLTNFFQYYAFDVIGEITYSKRFGFMSANKDVNKMISLISKILEASQIIGLFRPLVALQPLFIMLGESNKSVAEFAIQRVEEVKGALRDGKMDKVMRQDGTLDFCSKLITQGESGKAEKRGKFDPDILTIGACMSNVFAGSDTTSISLSATLFNILAHPDVLRKVRTELDDAAAKGELSSPPTFAETQKLPYLQAVLKESLRMHPATGIPLWREIPAPGATICGTWFPAGTSVGINSWVAHRNKEVWGKDADEFRPERWIESGEEQLRKMNAMYMPFGLGSRTCIGKNISLLEISKVIPHMIRKFDVSFADETAVKKKELNSRCTWFVKQSGFMVRISDRKGD